MHSSCRILIIHLVFAAISIVVDCLVVAFGFYTASRSLHEGALYPLFRAPMSFFDTNPLGRILNYFSTDMDTADLALPLDVQLWLIAMTSLLSTVITIAVAAPIFLAIIIPILLINGFVQVGTSFSLDVRISNHRSSVTWLNNLYYLHKQYSLWLYVPATVIWLTCFFFSYCKARCAESKVFDCRPQFVEIRTTFAGGIELLLSEAKCVLAQNGNDV